MPAQASGTFCSSSASQSLALPSEGARQSPRGERLPPETTFGPFGIAERLNWLIWKKRKRKTCSHFLMSPTSYACCASAGKFGGQEPCAISRHACHARKA